MMIKFAITMFGFGYFALCTWMRDFSKTASEIMFVSSVIFLIPIVTHHVFCGIVEWIYIRLGRTKEVREAVLEMQKKTIVTMFVGYLGLLVFMITLFVMIIMGNTSLPVWACGFNTLVVMLILAPTKLPAKGNIGGAEPCPFSPYSDINVRDTSLRAALKSKLFLALQDGDLLADDHNGGCVLYEKRKQVEELLH